MNMNTYTYTYMYMYTHYMSVLRIACTILYMYHTLSLSSTITEAALTSLAPFLTMHMQLPDLYMSVLCPCKLICNCDVIDMLHYLFEPLHYFFVLDTAH